MITALRRFSTNRSPIENKLTVALVIGLMTAVSAALGLLPAIHVVGSALLIALLAGHHFAKQNYLKALLWAAVFAVALFIALYRPPGFSYFNSISVEQLHEQGKPYQQFVNLGKFFGAAIIFIWLMLGTIKTDITLALRRNNLLIAAGATTIVLLSAVLLLNLHLAPKFSEITLIFLAINLVVTCFAEETFYRLVVQRPAEKAFSSVVLSRLFGVLIASVFFTLTHLSDQPLLLAVMIIAGILYAVTYAWTRSLTSAILVHFSVNALHFMLLPYPL